MKLILLTEMIVIWEFLRNEILSENEKYSFFNLPV